MRKNRNSPEKFGKSRCFSWKLLHSYNKFNDGKITFTKSCWKKFNNNFEKASRNCNLVISVAYKKYLSHNIVFFHASRPKIPKISYWVASLIKIPFCVITSRISSIHVSFNKFVQYFNNENLDCDPWKTIMIGQKG